MSRHEKPPPRIHRVGIGGVILTGAVSDSIDPNELQAGIQIVESWAAHIRKGAWIYEKDHDFGAGKPKLRYNELLWMLTNPWAWAAGGGYATSDLLLPYEVKGKKVMDLWRESRTVMAGYSDITGLAAMAFFIGLPFIMGSNLGSLSEWDKKTQKMMKEVWMGRGVVDIPPEARWKVANPGKVTGKLFSGNLSVASEALVSNYDWMNAPWMNGEKMIIGIEELQMTEVDAMRKFGNLFGHPRGPERIGGIIIGRRSELNTRDYPQYSKANPLEARIEEFIKSYYPHIPLAFLADMGHAQWGWGKLWRLRRMVAESKTFYPFTNGMDVTFEVSSENGCSLKYNETPWL